MNKSVVAMMILVLLFVGCSNADQLQPSPSPSPTEQEEPSQEPVADIAEPLLAEEGPWVLVWGQEGLWAANPDGSGLTSIDQAGPVPLALGGRHAAFTEETAGEFGSSLSLKIFSLPAGEVETIVELLPAPPESTSEENALDGRVAVYTALTTGNLAWSPDNTRLAFVSAHDGPSADLYVYSLEDGSITQLSDEPGQAFRPIWSPDGAAIIFMEATSFGTGAGYSMAGVWAACADGACLRRLYEPSSGDELAAGWLSTDTLLVYSWSALFGYHNLRAVNIETGESSPVWEHAFQDLAFDPKSGTALVSVFPWQAGEDPEIENGLYLVQTDGQARLAPVWDFFSEETKAQVSWQTEASIFFVRLSNEILSLSLEEQVDLVVPHVTGNPEPVLSPDGTEWIWFDGENLVLLGTETPIEVLFPSDSHPLWGPDGGTVLYIYQGQLIIAGIDGEQVAAVGSGFSGPLQWIGP